MTPDSPLHRGSDCAQVAWNRANRVAREFGVQVDYIGVFVGDDTTASSNWTDINAGYHLIGWMKGYHDVWEKGYHDDYQRGNNVIWEQGYHTDYQRGNTVVYQQGYHTDYQRGNNVSFEQGYHTDYQRGNTVVYQQGYHLDYQRGNTVVYQQGYHVTNWQQGNTSLGSTPPPGSNTNRRSAVPGPREPQPLTLASTRHLTPATTTESSSPARRVRGPTSRPHEVHRQQHRRRPYGRLPTTTTGTATSWGTITPAQYNLSNTTVNDGTDGFQPVNPISARTTTGNRDAIGVRRRQHDIGEHRRLQDDNQRHPHVLDNDDAGPIQHQQHHRQ